MNYFDVVNSSIDYIEENLCDEITIDDLSSMFYFSKFHYYRIFRALTNYSVSDYINKRRMCIGVDLLKNTDYTILDIAVRCGMNSHEVFTRNFKREFSLTPSQYRKNKIFLNSLNRITLVERDFVNKKNEIVVDYKIVEILELNLVGEYSSIRMDEFYTKSVSHFLEVFADDFFKRIGEDVLYFIITKHIKTTGVVEYFVGFEKVKDGITLTKNHQIPSGKFAEFTYRGIKNTTVDIVMTDVYKCIGIAGIEIDYKGIEFLKVSKDDNDKWIFEEFISVI